MKNSENKQEKDLIRIRGARVHNLKSVDLKLPRNRLIVITGLSGSGKSSLAFDTLYADGQRRYVESLSAYARQFLGVMEKPDVDNIEGISPAISIDQKSVSKNPRSTVGTITEIYDYLRLLFARVGQPFCPNCGQEIVKLSLDEISDKIMLSIPTLVKGKDTVRFNILAPIVRERKGEFSELINNLKQKGFVRVIIDKKLVEIEEPIVLNKKVKHSISAVIDTFALSKTDTEDKIYLGNLHSRIREAVEKSLNLSDGLVVINDTKGSDHLYSEKFSCSQCNISIPEVEPRLFSFNSPIGA